MIMSNPYDGERRAGTVGPPLPGVSARLMNDGGEATGDDEVGEVEVRSPHLFAEYWRRPDATAAAFHDGWFRTGDLAVRSADGYYTLRGRRGDLIISGGFNIYPREIEELLLEDPRVREVAVVGVRPTTFAAKFRWRTSSPTPRSTWASSRRCAGHSSRRSRCPARFVVSRPCPAPRSAKCRSIFSRRLMTKLTRQQIVGFWAAWTGWLLDGMDSVIYALVLAPALTELLPRSGMDASPAHVGFVGSILFAVFLAGWGFSFLWGPIADRFGRTRALAATILVYALFTGAAAFATNVWELGVFRFPRRDRRWRRVGDGRHVRRRGVAGGPAKDGRGLSADRILLRFLHRRRAQLHGRRALRLAGDVSLRLRPRRRLDPHAAKGERAGTMEGARG